MVSTQILCVHIVGTVENKNLIGLTLGCKFKCQTFSYGEGLDALNFKVLGSVVSRMRSCKSSKDMGKVFEEDCFEEIKKDHKKRG